MAPAVRAATADDLPALLALYRQLNPGDPEVDADRAHTVFRDILASSHFEMFVAELDGVVAGTCYLNVMPNLSRGLSPYAVLENVVTANGLRRRGVGRALVTHAVARAWQRGCYKVMLQTGSQRESTHAFYRGCGFSSDSRFAFVARHPGARTG